MDPAVYLYYHFNGMDFHVLWEMWIQTLVCDGEKWF